MEARARPSLLAQLDKANPKLKFLSDCFQYNHPDRPSIIFIARAGVIYSNLQLPVSSGMDKMHSNHRS